MVEQVGTFDQYTTVQPMFRSLPSWLSGDDQKRIASYSVYEQVYWNVPEAFKLVQRGSDSQPIYIPSGKQIVETLHRFLANDLSIVSDQEFGTDSERNTADQWLTELFRRERFFSKFAANKRYGIIRGDWLWHVTADPDRQQGSRISLMPVDPAAYFPIYNEENIDEVIGCHIVEPYTDDKARSLVRRLTYLKETERGGPSPIRMWDQIFEVDAWGQPGTGMREKIVSTVAEDVRLPDPIDSLPVYHIKNFEEPQNPWGSSELRGMERIIAAVNQSISDEELTLALEGLGVYKTTSGPPVDEDGNELPWGLGPGRVVEIDPEADFERVSGVSSIAPFQDHIKYLHDQIDMGSGTPAVAKGDVDVQVAESGVALALRMGPLLARSSEKENTITDVSVNMLYDLRKWGIAYEPQLSGPLQAVRWLPVYGEKIPTNRKTRFEEIMRLGSMNPPVVSRQWIREQLAELGFDFPDETDMVDQILEEKEIFGRIDADLEGYRLDSELNAVDNGQGAQQ